MISSLGYIGLNVTDAASWEDLLISVFALQRCDDGQATPRKYRIDEWHHRLALYESQEDSVAYIGWELAGELEMAVAHSTIESTGTTVAPLSKDECAERAVLEGFWFVDPVMRVRQEIFRGATVSSDLFSPARPMQGYVTGTHGMGHVVLMTEHQEAAVDFFTTALGFRVSDIMDFGGPSWGGYYRHVFLHCNSRHHSLAIMSPPAGGNDGDLNHLALTVRSFDDIGYAYDIARKKQTPVLMTLGKHINDLATSFYLATPSGSAIEMAYGGIEITENWSVKHYDDTKIWGHHVRLPPRPLE